MSNNKKNTGNKNTLLLVTAAVVAVLAVVVVFLNPGVQKDTTKLVATKADDNNNKETESTTENTSEIADARGFSVNEDGDVVIQIADITDQASFYEYDADGTAVGLFAVKASDGTIRTALNTCQVCNGSPYAYFEQNADKVQCQNCGNMFNLDMIEQERGGCNPVPISDGEKIAEDNEIIIPASYLNENAQYFKNWKKF
ncbi:hypothetical protein acsn021_31470 [Anaerocolumna cellulosilytica]|uniref:Uncharacterized protein n=1 Tax=Anaerocolumna cellulosilytica TaxID=433286 RepID=A0A6S6R9C8_9FIRM|nr:DUF2318 domain-containing protein [Anaerocolumna cellulosilytica]MBB5198079.1 putative membrane protein [Anaerocolumna cellulosilytica]BCJ95578.1 hypothetical protein acsn021_31470 [Anaerocolumna cellulosilytica]